MEAAVPVHSRDGKLRGTKMKTIGQMEADISQAIVKFEKQYMGRGPNEIRSHILGDMVIVRLRGVLTAAEQELAKSGGLERGTLLVKSVRTELIEKARPLLETIIHDVTGRRVRVLTSG